MIKITGKIRLKDLIPDDVLEKALHETGKYYESVVGSYIPLDTGKLRNSLRAEYLPKEVTFTWNAMNPRDGYGYAPIQHENMTYQHRYGTARWIEVSVQEHEANMKKIFFDTVVRGVANG